MLKITEDNNGVPGVQTESPEQAYIALGYLHRFYRPMQLYLLHTAGQGRMAELLAPTDTLVGQDALIHRLAIPDTAAQQARKLSSEARHLLGAYIRGIEKAEQRCKRSRALQPLFFRAPKITYETILSALMFSAYMGLGQSQERMERLILQALQHGADAQFLELFFQPHLHQWQPELLKQVSSTPPLPGFAAKPLFMHSGSNAWAINGKRTASGAPMLCGDPHLQINQIPSLLFETRIRFKNNFWLGATIPGLPGIAVGRNKNVSWSGTFSCADNVDSYVDDIVDGKRLVGSNYEELSSKDVYLQRRGLSPKHIRYQENSFGVYENTTPDGKHLSTNWSGKHNAHEAIEAYIRLPLANDALEAQKILDKAHTLSLHFVLADRHGKVIYTQAGTVPKRPGSWSGLYPKPFTSDNRWQGLLTGDNLPSQTDEREIVVSANEARPGPQGETLSTFSQPRYRYERIEKLLCESNQHDHETMRKIQCDTYSLQAEKLKPVFLPYLKGSPAYALLRDWNCRYEAQNSALLLFEICYREAIHALAPKLGGDWFNHKVETTELSLWWGKNIDHFLSNHLATCPDVSEQLSIRLGLLNGVPAGTYENITHIEFKHLVWGKMGSLFGQPSKSIELPGSRATIQQANNFNIDGQPVSVGPAYRMICDLSEDCIWSTLPGSAHEDDKENIYSQAIKDWQSGNYRQIRPPDDKERVKDSL